MSAKTFGLDIGSATMKAVAMVRSGNSISLEAAVVAPSSVNGYLSSSKADLQSLALSIKQMLANAQIITKSVNVSIPESQVYTKIIEIPQLSEQELEGALKWQTEQYIPLPLDQVRTDSQILDRREKDGSKIMTVLLVAAPISLIEKYETIIQGAGLIPEAIETELISAHRALFPLINTQEASMIVHAGASTTDIAITQNGVIQMAFPLSLGGLAITRAVALDLGIDVTQAEDLKRTYGLNTDMFDGKIGKSLRPILESIAGEIKKAVLLFKEKNENNPLKQIILSGGTAQLPGVDVFFTNTLGIQVTVGNCWDAYGIENVPDQLKAEASSYNVVSGLALRNLV